MKILTPGQMREVDRLSTTPTLILMENAGMRVAEVLEDRFENLDELTVAILCGKGNNGGDGLVVARQLIQKGCFPFVFLFASEEEVKGDAKINLDTLKGLGYPPTMVVSEQDWAEERLELLDADIIVDALLGTGARQPVEGLYKTVIESLAEDFPRAEIVAVDVPSPGVQAEVTVTFTALKPSLVFYPDCEDAGDVILAEIGNNAGLLENENYKLHLIEPHELPARVADSNKGTYGRVLIVGGSRGKTGAAAMAGMAALRAGAGLVTVASAQSAIAEIAAHAPELMTEPLRETESGAIALNANLRAIVEGKTVIAMGPGLGRYPQIATLVASIAESVEVPLVLDADALEPVSAAPDRTRVLTPHPGEMARLTGKTTAEVQADRICAARQYAAAHSVTLVLKGQRTVIAFPDGRVWINPTGTPALGTGGSGDILTGLIAGLLAQFPGRTGEAVAAAVYLHGLAGEIGARTLGEKSLIATDLLRFLPAAMEECANVPHRL